MNYWRIILSLFTLILFIGDLNSQNPGQRWQMYVDPAEAGWPKEKLQAAKAFAEEMGSAAFLIVHDGKVVDYWGDIERRFLCHSIRKSFLSGLMGVYVDQGIIDLSTSLQELGIDDIQKLTSQEKQATIADLLKARSGVYHPAAAETDIMAARRPERGSHPPGTFFYYNNWDFNALRHIIMLHSNKDFYQDFKERFADPLQMEDFRLADTHYFLEADKSQFPAYTFRMSARDMARFGQLYLQEGMWNGEQIISREWVAESTQTYSYLDTVAKGPGYGYLWWTNMYGTKRTNYSARGLREHAIIIYPEENVVLVNRVNTFMGNSVSKADLTKWTEMIFAAKSGPAQTTAKITPLPHKLDQYSGPYVGIFGETVITRAGDRLLSNNNQGARFYLYPVLGSEDIFFIEDLELKVKFLRDEEGNLTGKTQVVY